MTWNRAWSPKTITDVTVGFDRLGSLLLPAEGAVGFTLVGSTLTSLGPFPIIPIDRAQNRFRLGATMTATAGKHTLTSGFAVTRLQYNGIEPDGALGITLFANDFGRDAITNFRSGTASRLIISLGSPTAASETLTVSSSLETAGRRPTTSPSARRCDTSRFLAPPTSRAAASCRSIRT